MRRAWWRLSGWAVVAELQRLARDGVVIRALVAPPVVVAVTLGCTVAVVASSGPPMPVVVEDAGLVGPLVEAGFEVQVVSDAPAALSAGQSDRSVTWEATHWVLTSQPTGWAQWSDRRAYEDVRLEAVVRSTVGAGWVLSVPARPEPARDVPRQVRILLRLMILLYTLYAVVLSVVTTVRDRERGLLEAGGALPVPGWVRPGARTLAVAVAVGAPMSVSLVLIGALLGHARPLAWMVHGGAAVLAGVALGTLAPTGLSWRAESPWLEARSGLSAPLSRALVLSTGLVGLGLVWPKLGAWLPIAGLVVDGEAVCRWCGVGIAACALAWCVRRAGRGGW